MSWVKNAACYEQGIDAFYPDEMDRKTQAYSTAVASAFEFCDRCPVRVECLHSGTDPIDPISEHGIAGRLTAHSRKTYRLGKRIVIR